MLLGLALAAQDTPVLKFADLYRLGGVYGLEFSPQAQSLRGKTISIQGYVLTPPGEGKLFVLSQQPKQVCAPCANPADWPRDVSVVFMPEVEEPLAPRSDEVLVYLPQGLLRPSFPKRVRVSGRLELGQQADPTTGFVSLARIYADRVEGLETP
ncbi:MAG: hypothetical protein IVW51_11665 [Thermaceae bacterium]|nr:hypothetical protein [Thermaceae bacterium]